MRLITIVAVLGCGAAEVPLFTGFFDESMEGHAQFGVQVGKRFAPLIKERLAANTYLQQTIVPFLDSDGSGVYEKITKAHEEKYPQYMAEIRGMADGAGVPERTLIANNLIQEFGFYAPLQTELDDHCSDYAVNNGAHAFVLHNEDSDPWDVNHTYLANVTFGQSTFKAYTYMGDLPTGAFGWVPGLFAFTLNKVHPLNGTINQQGFGRGFVSRDLLTATSLDEARRIIENTPMIGGHNYQLLDLAGARLSPPRYLVEDFEVYHEATTGRVRLTEGSPPHFHANTYVILRVPHAVDVGSQARMNRAAQLPPPTDLQSAVAVLGDTYNASYPVYHGGPQDVTGIVTLCTMHFDLKTLTWHLYLGNPKLGKIVMSGSLL